MSFSENVGVTGRVVIEVRDRDGTLIEVQRVKNLVTLEGRRLLGRCLAGETGLTGQLHMAVGTGFSSPALRNERLEAEVTRVVTHPATVTQENDRVVLHVNATFPRLTGSAREELREAGIVILQPDNREVLFNRVVFPVVTRSADLEISLSWEVLF
ncbi:MAG TPA: hypothetical protein PLA94_21540 [Myxococcota bacterium]|nr:hypothetical protein [Myxococcota bacterium]